MNIIGKVLRKIKKLILKNNVRSITYYPFVSKTGVVITHISAYGNGNMGDTYLPIALRNLFNTHIGVTKWIASMNINFHTNTTTSGLISWGE